MYKLKYYKEHILLLFLLLYSHYFCNFPILYYLNLILILLCLDLLLLSLNILALNPIALQTLNYLFYLLIPY